MRKLTSRNVTYNDWLHGRKPFDVSTCGRCLTQIAVFYLDRLMPPNFMKLKIEAKALGLDAFYDSETDAENVRFLRKNFSKFVRLRKKYAHLWPKP